MENQNQSSYKDLPIYKKGLEIFNTAKQICDLIPEDDEHLQSIGGFILEDAAKLSFKIAGAQDSIYDLKMEAAAIIRKAAKDLMVKNHSLEMFGFKDVEYFNIIREQIEEYRYLFIDWVATFDPWDYMIDRWGLFNPPGVGPHDKDPDDDIPFDPDDYFDK